MTRALILLLLAAHAAYAAQPDALPVAGWLERAWLSPGNIPHRVTEVNLVDRSDLAKPLLIGRRFIRGRFLVDMGRRHLLEPTCARKTAP